MSEQINPISNEEARTLIMGLAVGQGNRGVIDEEADTVCKWAHRTRLSAALLELVLDGEVLLTIDDNYELRFHGASERERQIVLHGSRAAA